MDLEEEIENIKREEHEKEMEEYLQNNYSFPTPKTNFIDSYIRYASSLTDCPIEFHFLAAESILSVISDRKVYMEFADGIKYLNTYLMAVAPPSAGKSSGFKIYLSILEAIGLKDKVLPTKCTPESMIRILSQDSHKVYTHDEYSIFLQDAKDKKYNAGIIGDLLSFYDDTRDTIPIAGRGGSTQQMDEFGNEIKTDIDLKELFFNQLVFIQNGAYAKHITDYDFDRGFPQRFQTLFANNITYRPLTNLKPSDIILRNRLIYLASTIKENLPDKLKLIFTDYQLNYIFENIETYYREKVKDIPSLANFPRRFNEQIYKLSGMLAMDEICSQSKPTSEIHVTTEQIDRAIKYLKEIYFESLIQYVSEHGVEKIKTRTDFDKVMTIATRHITKHGGKLPRKELTPLLNIIGQDLKTFYAQALAEEKLVYTQEINPKTKKSNQYVSLPKE